MCLVEQEQVNEISEINILLTNNLTLSFYIILKYYEKKQIATHPLGLMTEWGEMSNINMQ